jgi:hypothetical protein
MSADGSRPAPNRSCSGLSILPLAFPFHLKRHAQFKTYLSLPVHLLTYLNVALLIGKDVKGSGRGLIKVISRYLPVTIEEATMPLDR